MPVFRFLGLGSWLGSGYIPTVWVVGSAGGYFRLLHRGQRLCLGRDAGLDVVVFAEFGLKHGSFWPFSGDLRRGRGWSSMIIPPKSDPASEGV